jgi:dihydrofolate synthase / folylpolyglutamate synthase
MIVTAIKTELVDADYGTLEKFLDNNLKEFEDGCILAITSKIAALCENRVVPIGEVSKEELAKKESSYYLPSSISKYKFTFTITDRTLIPAAGIDESNGDGHYVLWPKDLQQTVNGVRDYLVKRFGVKKVGVVLTDSTARPMHYGTDGIGIAFSGFTPMNSYVGKPDLFGRTMEVSVANIVDALASAAVVVMGEGTEQTPIAIIKDVPFVNFLDHNPTQQELDKFYISHLEDDLFAPFINRPDWQKGGRGTP